VEWITKKMAYYWGAGAVWDIDGGCHPHEARFLKLDISKARNQLGWYPRLRLQEALEWTVVWARERQQELSVRETTLRQIREYQTRIEQTNIDD
jgi:CDP-glucose 4,6-dehydratase